MDINIVDTTLRDGEQKACMALGIKEKVEIAKILNIMGVEHIEAGTAAMGGEEKKSIEKIVELDLGSKISSWNRMNVKDIEHSMDCGVDIVHMSVPSSDLQIKFKLGKDRSWVISNMRKCIYYTLNKGYEITVGLEDASRADINFLIELSSTVSQMGVKRIRYSDTVGVLTPTKTFYQVKKLKQEVPIDVEIHTHNDFGMALANSLGAAEAGARYIDCTVTGIGERAGNCNFINFIKAVGVVEGNRLFPENFDSLIEMEQSIQKLFTSSC